MSAPISITALPDFPLVEPGDDLAELIVEAAEGAGLPFEKGDLLVIAQKIFSKAEDRYVRLADVTPGAEALELAPQIDKDPRLVQLILDESVEVVRHRPGAVIVEHRNGYVHANAGIDQSNIASDEEDPRVLLLPLDPDASAQKLRELLLERTGCDVAIIMNDSAGRAWRVGTAGFALGTAGIEPLVDMIGQKDLFGRPMEVTKVAVADELAAAASFVMGQADEAAPVVLIRGARFNRSEGGSRPLIRAKHEDMFR